MLQDSSLDFKLVQRICLLQQALDQATKSLEEMQQQVANHQMLQAHLAQTEEYSNVQQKIILNLKQQLEAKDQWQQQVLEKLLAGIKRLIDEQQLELERLRVRTYQSQTEVQDYLVRLKNHYQSLAMLPGGHSGGMPTLDLNSEVMIARALTVSLSSQLQTAQQHIQQLDNTLTRHQVNFARLQVYAKALADPNQAMAVRPEAAAALPSPVQAIPDADIPDDPIALRAIIEAQRQKIEELSTELGEQFRHQTNLRSRCQEIAAERDHLKQQELTLRLEYERLKVQVSEPAETLPQEPQAKIHTWQAATEQPNPLSRFRLTSS
jgi:hypothetical protein